MMRYIALINLKGNESVNFFDAGFQKSLTKNHGSYE